MLKRGVTLLTVAILGGYIIFNIYQYFKPPEFKVIFFNVGQGDASLISFKTGEKMLVDCGPDRSVLAKLGRWLPFYDRTIDYLLVTHFDSDHYGGCADVLKRYKILKVITNGTKKESDPQWQSWSKALSNEQAVEQIIDSPIKEVIGGVVFNYLTPDKSILNIDNNDPNNNSVTFIIRDNGLSFIFTGDLDSTVEDKIISKYCQSRSSLILPCPYLASDVIKIAHHGSDTSSSEEFLAAVNPEQAVISAGINNMFGHPSLRIIRRLQKMNITILRTDLENDILIQQKYDL